MTQPVTIDPFSTVAGSLVVDGVKHDVLHLTGREYRKLNSRGAEVLDYFDVAERIVPSLGEKANDFTAIQIVQVIAVADGRISEVELQFPNSSGPTPPNASEAPAPASQ